MMSSTSKSAHSNIENVVKAVLETFQSLGLKPRRIPSGRIEELRGGITSIALEPKGNVDAAIILSRIQYQSSDLVYKLDYAVRGNIKGILPARILAVTDPKLKGMIKKTVSEVKWALPQTSKGTYPSRGMSGDTVTPPGPGELCEEGPHQKLVDALNQDVELEGVLRKLIGERSVLLSPWVITDPWGESLRITADYWVKPGELQAVYVTALYATMVERIGRHIKEVRRAFGGVAF
jgi:hypothetical protein